ncbi:hypothetical protein H5410_028329 [Solanum commersonii]|uniref:Uncharacterized protein n=1 Tax=Solanum commersonii TaxID=4109 RepID=A0A9J5Z3Q5_SOLCO|nr:hypothetical protein H5410_028329 [Solanum commersonii]
MAFRKSSDFLYKDSTDVVFADLSHVGPITRRKFKNGRLDGSEYFTSLETVNLASVFFGELSQIGSNFGESDNSMDSPTSMNVNALMADSTNMDENLETFVSIKLSPSKGDMQTNIDNEQLVFCYIPREHREKGQSLLEECTQQVHPPRKELSYTTFQDLKEKMIVPVAQVLSITLKPCKGNTQVGKIKGNLIKRFSHYLKNQTLVFSRIGSLTPRASSFERLGRRNERKSSKQVDKYATTSKTFVFHRLETKRKVILSIDTYGSLKVKSTIVVTNQFHGETKKEEDEAITGFEGSQREDSNSLFRAYLKSHRVIGIWCNY